MVFSKVLWRGARKRFWHHVRCLVLALVLAPGVYWLAGRAPAAGAVALGFVLYAALLYQSYVLAVIGGMVCNLTPEVRRKLAHMVGGGHLIAAAATTGSTALLLALCGLLLAWMLATRHLAALKMFRQLSVDRRDGTRSWGDVLFPLGMAGSALLVAVDSPSWLAAALVLVLADSAAALVGVTYGRHRYRLLGGRKSLEGSAAFFISALLCLLAVRTLSAAPWPLLACIGTAALASVVEAACGSGWDNLWLPCSVLLGVELSSHYSPATVLGMGLLVAVAALAVVTLQRCLRPAPSS